MEKQILLAMKFKSSADQIIVRSVGYVRLMNNNEKLFTINIFQTTSQQIPLKQARHVDMFTEYAKFIPWEEVLGNKKSRQSQTLAAVNIVVISINCKIKYLLMRLKKIYIEFRSSY